RLTNSSPDYPIKFVSLEIIKDFVVIELLI
ncbi:hypothetical protein KSS87_006005, partial [Heliosperma pusillum]